MSEDERYHVLLIGCDLYPPTQRSLWGCVNDIDAIEEILLGGIGVDIPASQILITRLAAPHEEAVSLSRYVAETILPTKDNIITALKSLSSPKVDSKDRVLIYYSGHGGQTKRSNREGWFECIVGCDNKLLFDDELNPLIATISERTSDLTVVLDCCHSAGVTRDANGEAGHGAARFAEIHGSPDYDADLVIVPNRNERSPGSRLLQTPNANYVVIVACQADERAHEDAIDGARSHGFLTYSLINLLHPLSADRRARLRWADIWPRLLGEVTMAAAKTGHSAQHPWIIGRPERRIFGGPWHPQDPGFQISRRSNGSFVIEAGSLVGLTAGAVVGIYGSTPDRFPSIGTPEDIEAQIGMAKITRAERTTCVAEAINHPPNPLPLGTRARLIKQGENERLRVWIDQSSPGLVSVLAQSPLLQFVQNNTSIPEVWISRTPSGWEISDDTNHPIALFELNLPRDATQPEGAIVKAYERLRAGLESYARYNLVLRLAKHCTDPNLDQSVLVSLHDCRDTQKLQTADPKRPNLPELVRNIGGIYEVAAETLFCIRLTSNYWQTLYLTAFDCSAGGMVQFLGSTSIRAYDTDCLWFGDMHRSPFSANPDNPEVDSIDRLVTIATTRPGVDLSGLEVTDTVQAILDGTSTRGITGTAQVDLWTAIITPLKICKKA